MAGHSQFKNIMHRKGAQDQKRAKIFNKISREIIVATKGGMPDPAFNPRLRAAIQSARAANMPKDRVEKAIKVATQGVGGDNYEAIRYEGYGPGGIAVIVEALTDNKNRTAADVRAAFNKSGGSLGETNSVSFMFDNCGLIIYEKSKVNLDTLFEKALEAGADDVKEEGDVAEVIMSRENFGEVRELLEKELGEPQEASLTWRPHNLISVDEDTARTLLKLIDTLEDNDDVQTVFSNFEVSEELMEKLTA